MSPNGKRAAHTIRVRRLWISQEIYIGKTGMHPLLKTFIFSYSFLIGSYATQRKTIISTKRTPALASSLQHQSQYQRHGINPVAQWQWIQ